MRGSPSESNTNDGRRARTFPNAPPWSAQCGSPFSQQSRLVDQVREIGSGHSGCRRGEPIQIDIAGEGDLARMHPEDFDSPFVIGRMNHDRAHHRLTRGELGQEIGD